MNRKVLLIVVLLAIAGSIYFLEQQKAVPGNTEHVPVVAQPVALSEADQERIADKEALYTRAPELRGVSGYLNTPDGTLLSDFRGKVVLVDFWTYSCINCIRTLPHLTAWDAEYRDDGLVIVGVHTPEFEFEKNKDNVRAAMEKYGIEYAVVQDNDYATWRAFNNHYWPHKFLIDADGFIRYDHIGEGGYEETEKNIQELLLEINESMGVMSISMVTDATPRHATTPELYLGYGFALPRGQNLGNDGGFRVGEDFTYTTPERVVPHVVYLSGAWKSNQENIEATGNTSMIVLAFRAASVHIVAESGGTASVMIDGSALANTGIDVMNGMVDIEEPRLYTVAGVPYGDHILTVTVGKGTTINAFTFG